MKKTYRVIKSTYKGKDSFMVSSVVGSKSDLDCDGYVDADSIPDLTDRPRSVTRSGSATGWVDKCEDTI